MIPRWTRPVLAVVALAVGVACASDPTPKREEPTKPAEATTAEPVKPSPSGPKAKVRILVTTDEHGWLESFMDRPASVRRGGAVEVYAQLVRQEDLGKPDVLLVSGGDMWTGPYETTVLEGAPMVSVFNRMGYRAAAVGNHEFDFGTKILEKRASEAKFPFLAANLKDVATGAVPPWAKPWTIVDVGGTKLGIVGLTNKDARETTDPRHLTGLEFLPYKESLEAELPKVRAGGAVHVMVVIHDRIGVVHELIPVMRANGVSVVAVGHAHQSGLFIDDGATPDDVSDDIVLCNGGPYMRSYCRIDVAWQGSTLVERSVSIQQVELGLADPVADADPELLKVVDEARVRSEKIGGEVLANASTALVRKDDSLGQFIVDTWRESLPYTQVAITNKGGIRQDLGKGPIKVRDIVGVLPFNNYLLVVELTGAELRQVLANPESIASGVKYTYRDTDVGRAVLELTDTSGKAIADDTTLRVVINDFMYRGGDRYAFIAMDAEPEETAIDWREPVLRTLRAHGRDGKPLSFAADQRAKRVE